MQRLSESMFHDYTQDLNEEYLLHIIGDDTESLPMIRSIVKSINTHTPFITYK